MDTGKPVNMRAVCRAWLNTQQNEKVQAIFIGSLVSRLCIVFGYQAKMEWTESPIKLLQVAIPAFSSYSSTPPFFTNSLLSFSDYGTNTDVLIHQTVLQPRVDLEDKAKLANDDEELKNVVEISSVSDSEASTCHMDERRLALRARHKGKVTTTEKGKDKAVDLASADPTLVARLPSVGASPIAVALDLAHQPRQRTPGSRQASDSSAPTTSKKAKRTLDSNRDEGVPTAKAFIFRRLEQLIIASDLQPFEGTSPSYLLQPASYHSLRAQLFQVGLNNAIKALSKDSELLKSAKASRERESSKKLAVELRSAWEIALKEFRESETFHEEAMILADMHARTVVDKWLAGPMGKQFLLDLGEEDYDLGY
nr:phosphatase and actin regulator 4A-like [Ipomoea batatas]